MKFFRIIKKHWPELGLLILFAGLGIHWYFTKPKPPVPKAETKNEAVATQPSPQPTPPAEPIIPSAKTLSVPYTVQAPLVNWNVHEESCEEAAALMYHYFLASSKLNIIPTQTADSEMRAMKNWQVKNYGREPDLNLTQLGEFMKGYYGYRFRVTNSITADTIKKEIAAGNPVLVPVITHALGNPHYGRNPSYHILVIKGYDANGVITNDAGVKEGRNYYYAWATVWHAIDAQIPQMKQRRDLLVVTK